MLVLSRRINQTVVFPNSGISLHVLGVRGNQVKLGIEAPPEVQVLREELAGTGSAPASTPPVRGPSTHALRNRLNKLTLMLHLFERQWAEGQEQQAQETLDRVLSLLEAFDREWASPAPPRRLRSLIVEDDNNERELLAGLLSMNGCECETAADGLEALEYLATHEPPDVVLLDMRMPRCDGPQTLSRIRQDPRCKDLKVFAISGTTPQEAGIRTGPDGVDAWFGKPLNPRTLWHAIQQSVTSPTTSN